jgi:hypothetical protein
MKHGCGSMASHARAVEAQGSSVYVITPVFPQIFVFFENFFFYQLEDGTWAGTWPGR